MSGQAKELNNAVEVEEVEESTSKNNKYFLNILITLPSGKKVKVAMTTLDWNLKNGSKAQKAFTKALINKYNEKGEAVNIKGLSATFVIAGSTEEAEDDMDFDSMFE